MKRIGNTILAALIIWLSLTPAAAGLGAPLVSFFPDTGHQVQGDFLAYFHAHGGETILGKPLTEEFIAGGMTVQVFEQAVIEKPLGAPASAIRLRAIGDKLGKAEPRLPSSAIPQSDEAARRYFPATGHAVCPAFLVFFEANGGAAFFGYPISDILVEEGVTVQYFQNAALQWHQGDKSVRLGPLGQLYLKNLDLPESLLRPVQPPAAAPHSATQSTPCPFPEPLQTKLTENPVKGYIPKLPLLLASSNELQVAMTAKYSRTGLGGAQTLYLHVRDRHGEHVAYAQVDVIVRAVGGEQRVFALRTDPSGRASLTFDISHLPEGHVVIDARASCGKSKGLGQTAFVVSG